MARLRQYAQCVRDHGLLNYPSWPASSTHRSKTPVTLRHGDLLFGRAGTVDARKVSVTFPRSGEAVGAPVADSGFFAVRIPDRASRSLLIEVSPDPAKNAASKDGGPILSFQCDRVFEILLVALDGQDHVVAHGVAVAPPECGPRPTSGPSR
ncbi:hypothetical protein [Dactylosporangium darangshiense]|uniref:Uncharacterized protein n=1 Tax=Dactylosporangium darangshiense TaxID=579108 RepID=A0ABP8DP70_9ACTN